MDAYGGEKPLPSGIYRLAPITPAGLQRWTRIWWKCMCFPPVSGVLWVIAKSGLDGQEPLGAVG
jgi:hypothetical protein